MSRKNTMRGKLKAASQEERIQKWKEHFKNLLGNISKDTDRPIKKKLNINRIKTETEKFLGKIRTIFWEIDPPFHRFWQFIESSKEFVQKISCLTTVHSFRFIFPLYGIKCFWEIYKHIVSPNELLQLQWCFIKTQKQWFAQLMETQTSTFSLDFCLERQQHHILFIICQFATTQKNKKRRSKYIV